VNIRRILIVFVTLAALGALPGTLARAASFEHEPSEAVVVVGFCAETSDAGACADYSVGDEDSCVSGAGAWLPFWQYQTNVLGDSMCMENGTNAEQPGRCVRTYLPNDPCFLTPDCFVQIGNTGVCKAH